MDKKQCSRCKELKPLDEFYRKYVDNPHRLVSWCKSCYKDAHNKTGNTHKYTKKYDKKLTQKERYAEDKNRFFNMYGGTCQCCGESIKTFLTIDHINGQAGKKRESAHQAYINANREYNPNEYRILCHNCNHAVRLGICPHQERK